MVPICYRGSDLVPIYADRHTMVPMRGLHKGKCVYWSDQDASIRALSGSILPKSRASLLRDILEIKPYEG